MTGIQHHPLWVLRLKSGATLKVRGETEGEAIERVVLRSFGRLKADHITSCTRDGAQ